MTECVMALPHGSGVRDVDSPRASARAKVNGSVTDRDRLRERAASRRRVSPARMLRVVYLDTADSWLFRESTPSVQAIFRDAYVDALPKDSGPLLLWCAGYRYFAAAVALVLNAALWLLIHPLRGPITLTVAGALVACATH